MVNLVAVSPLADRAAALASLPALAVREVPFAQQITLHVVGLSETLAAAGFTGIQTDALQLALGVTFPREANTVTRSTLGASVLWLSPGEFLWISDPGVDCLDALTSAAAASEGNAKVVDTSAQRFVVDLSGPKLFEVLSKGCSLELERLGQGACAQAPLAQMGVIYVGVAPAGEIRLLVRSSFARYFVDWLVAATAEYR